MKNNAFLSLVISFVLTLFFLFLKLFNFNNWGELLSVFYLGLVWFVFVFVALNFLQKQFPSDFPTFNVDVEKTGNTFLKKENKTENSAKKSYAEFEVQDKIDIDFATSTPKNNPDITTKSQEKKTSKPQKPYTPGELDADSFNFEPEKMANAVRNMLNKD